MCALVPRLTAKERLPIEAWVTILFFSFSTFWQPGMLDRRIWVDRNSILGKGQFSKVFLGKLNINQSNELQVAVKRVLKDDLQPDAGYHLLVRNIANQSNQRKEETLGNLNHPNIIKLLCVEDDGPFRYFALELCAASLHQYCTNKYDGPMPTEPAVLLDIVSGLVYIHSKGLAHRNIEPKNILISSTLPVSIILSDFGFSKPVSTSGSFSFSGDYGTHYWKAPEMLDDQDDEAFSEKRGSVASDTFSAGCVFFYFLTMGYHPFGNISSDSIRTNILKGRPVYEKYLPDQHKYLEKLIGPMIANKPKNRIALNTVHTKLKEILEIYDFQPDGILLEEDGQPLEDRPDWLM